MASLYHADYLQGGVRRRRPSMGHAMVQRGGLRNPFSPYRHSVKRTRKPMGGRSRKTRKATVGGRKRRTRKGGAMSAGAMSAGAVKKRIHALLKHL